MQSRSNHSLSTAPQSTVALLPNLNETRQPGNRQPHSRGLCRVPKGGRVVVSGVTAQRREHGGWRGRGVMEDTCRSVDVSERQSVLLVYRVMYCFLAQSGLWGAGLLSWYRVVMTSIWRNRPIGLRCD